MGKKDEEREKRLAAALRENLKRRKAQARGGTASEARGPLHQPAAGPPPRPGED
jgi:hypothetical protein